MELKKTFKSQTARDNFVLNGATATALMLGAPVALLIGWGTVALSFGLGFGAAGSLLTAAVLAVPACMLMAGVSNAAFDAGFKFFNKRVPAYQDAQDAKTAAAPAPAAA